MSTPQRHPLTHLLDAARAVMFEGAGLLQVGRDLVFLALTALFFLAFGRGIPVACRVKLISTGRPASGRNARTHSARGSGV
jgi:hypothetical protein